MEFSQKPWRLATILPGALLVLVACSQIYMAHTGELTPSKGGGFGMFAAVDMRSARAWSVDCLDADGSPCRALIFAEDGPLGDWLTERFRTKPDAAARAEAADRIFAARFVPASHSEVVRDRRLGQTLELLPPGWPDTPLMRLQTSGNSSPAQPARLRAIRFQAWRMRYDATTNQVRCEPIGPPELRGRW